MARCYLISGCSGGGKSTLLDALGAEGCQVVPEPGRRIVAEGVVLPWDDPAGFARRALEMARADLAAASALNGPVYFDRGLLDAACGLEAVAGVPLARSLGDWPYAAPVFLAPPWPEIFVQDAERRHGLAEAVAEFGRLEAACARLGVATCLLPKARVAERVRFVLDRAG